MGSSRLNSSSLQWKHRSGPLRAYSGRSSSRVSMTSWRIPSRPASRRVSSSSAVGYVSESAVTSSAPSPSASLAARARKVESTPPEKATITRLIPRRSSTSRSYLGARAEASAIAGYPSTGAARSASGTIGRAPTWAMTSAAASEPRRPQVGRSRPWASP